jgi:glycosyltransferase involved in cell wall biosynthesis
MINSLLCGGRQAMKESPEKLKSKLNKCKKYDICVVTHPFVNPAGSVLLSNFIDLLEPLSNELYVITGMFLDRSPSDQISIIKIKSETKKLNILIRVFKYIVNQLIISYWIIKLSKNIEFIIFYIGTGIFIFPVATSKLLGKKTVLIATELISENAKASKGSFNIERIIFRYIFKNLESINRILSDKIIIDSNVESDNLIRQFGLTNHRHKVFFGGVLPIDLNLFRIKEKLKDRKNIIGYIGRYSPEKGVMNFAKAIPLILEQRKDLGFLVCGNGELFENVKKELKSNGSYDYVTLTGWIPHENLSDYFNKMKLIVVPSYTETVPYVILEAMACGTPIVASPVDAIPDLIKDGENGFLMEDNSPECISKSVLKSLDDQRLDEIAKRAHDLINSEYTFEKAIDKYRNFLIKNNERRSSV